MGMAVGIFVAATPTIPFQTLIAVALAFVMRGSKAAAAVGVWLSNPITFPLFYLASYKTGTLLFGISDGRQITSHATSDMLKLGVDITIAAVTGGIVIGIILGIGAYFFTYKAATKIRSREKRHKGLFYRRKVTEDRKQKTADSGQRTADRELKTEYRDQGTNAGRKIAPAMISATPTEPACEYSTTIRCQPLTKDQRPGT
jgi:uncharacterized protein (DUF2062 family)